MVVYIDILILVNLCANFFLLSATSVLARVQASGKREFVSALAGAFSSLIIFVDTVPFWLQVLFKLLVSAVMVFIAFGFKLPSRFFKLLLFFYITSFLFAGIMAAIWFFVMPQGMYFHNGAVYFHISLPLLLGLLLVCYFVAWLIKKFTSPAVEINKIYQAVISYNGNQIHVKAAVDTGNQLTDDITATPVAVCQLASLLPVFDTQTAAWLAEGYLTSQPPPSLKKFRLIAYHSLSGDSLLPAFKPDGLNLSFNGSNILVEDVYIGIYNEKISSDFQMLLHPALVGVNIKGDNNETNSTKMYNFNNKQAQEYSKKT